MITLFDTLFRTLLKSGTTQRQAEAKVLKDLGISKWQAKEFQWEKHLIIEIDEKNKYILLKNNKGDCIPIKSDNKSFKNIKKGIFETQFIPKFRNDSFCHIYGWTYSYSIKNPPEFFIELRTRIKPENQSSKKRTKMYNRRKIKVSEFFIKNLIQKML